MNAILLVSCGALGLAVGSFLNVVIWRLPRRQSLSRPPSHCPSCSEPIRAYDNIPVASWVWLRGRCRHCGQAISARYPMVELITAGLFVAAGWQLGMQWALVDVCVFFAVLVALSGIDLDHHLIPSRVVYPAAVASLALLATASALGHSWPRYEDALLGGVVGFVALFVIHFIQPRGLGFGDVRLAGLIGLNVGWFGLARVGISLFAGFALGALVGLGLMASGRAGRKARIPFGPFLAAGAVVAVLWGGPLVRAWLGGG